MNRASSLILLLFIAAACSTTQPVNMSEPRRVVGTENDVRIDAEVFGDTLTPNVSIPIKYDISNNRSTTILIADLLLNATYDPDTLTVTVDIGSEIPGEQYLPRLIPIPSGGKKSFSAAAHVNILRNPSAAPSGARTTSASTRS